MTAEDIDETIRQLRTIMSSQGRSWALGPVDLEIEEGVMGTEEVETYDTASAAQNQARKHGALTVSRPISRREELLAIIKALRSLVRDLPDIEHDIFTAISKKTTQVSLRLVDPKSESTVTAIKAPLGGLTEPQRHILSLLNVLEERANASD